MSDDYAANAQTTGSVAVGGSATGTIESAYDHDWFAVELMAGRTYRFDLQGSPGGGGTLPDTYFRAIRNSEGRYQSGTYNDNFEGSRDSRVTFTPSESGTYYAQVSGDRNETGTYTLSVSDVTRRRQATHRRPSTSRATLSTWRRKRTAARTGYRWARSRRRTRTAGR